MFRQFPQAKTVPTIKRLRFVSDREKQAVAHANMRLYLSTRKPWNSVYTTEDGKAIYKTTTPWKICERKTSIERIVPSKEIGNMRDEFAHLAEVDYGVFSSSHIRYGGQDLVTRDFFRKGAWSWRGRQRSVMSTGCDYQCD